ncbi:hypothetical protein [Coraliomargarita akajimensis]|uniref:Neuromedin U n=1 Tax=Coraliomargarita akajimensis (strain DSM 45221 / IAM 15411 / JCM 23193 / KCTC 12865 / 04OKA010-24) TaxID=583355 RepID=D5EPV5_CORAD|nr:hypothetical protein [Coraliomargarita akajimensis]ADE55688.1 conserved hypothetical protein [Coraliomargarita akajimensis DSM 45221]
MRNKLTPLVWAAACLLANIAAADSAAQANNPLANMKAFNLHNYYIGDLTGPANEANQFWLRYAQPISLGDSQWLVRASLPVNTFPAPISNETGLGDFNVFAAYLFDTGNPGVSVGLGPQLTAPTATNDFLGSEKWSAGLAHVFFDGRNKRYQYGYLLTWQHSFAGNGNREDVNAGALQPFFFYQLGGGTYLRSAAVCTKNFENDAYSIPVGLGIGQVFKKGDTVYNAFIEPQYSLFDDGFGIPKWQIFVGFNMQFLGK